MLPGLRSQKDPSSAPGLPCPECGYKIQVTVPQILAGGQVFCTGCGLRLTIDQEESAPAIEALQRLNEALDDAAQDIAAAQQPRGL